MRDLPASPPKPPPGSIAGFPFCPKEKAFGNVFVVVTALTIFEAERIEAIASREAGSEKGDNLTAIQLEGPRTFFTFLSVSFVRPSSKEVIFFCFPSLPQTFGQPKFNSTPSAPFSKAVLAKWAYSSGEKPATLTIKGFPNLCAVFTIPGRCFL